MTAKNKNTNEKENPNEQCSYLGVSPEYYTHFVHILFVRMKTTFFFCCCSKCNYEELLHYLAVAE